MFPSQLVENPFGITVFGSSIIRVDPDIALLHLSATRLEPHPKQAFRKAREGAKSINTYLNQTNVEEFGSSRITLHQSFRYDGKKQVFEGYKSEIEFRIKLIDLDRVEEILLEVINAGANNINAIKFQTSRLKELRADARRQAISAAREKAQVYCEAAGITLGSVIHIEDVNPENLKTIRSQHVSREISPDVEDSRATFNPGSIAVGGAVLMSFKII